VSRRTGSSSAMAGTGATARRRSASRLSAHGVKLVFQRLAAKLGIAIHPHKLRHTFSTDFLNHGGSVADLQRILGHESLQMSLDYAHITNTDAVERQKSNSVVDRQWRRAK
jgi:site-specific recombinase XerD